MMAILKSKQAHVGHAAGIYSDMTLDGPEIGTLVAVVDRAKNLPNRKTIGKQDPYCAMRLAKEAKKTDTDRRGGQTPKWDQELRFTVHDSPDYYKLKVSVFNDDKKTDLIGEAWIDLTDVIKLGGGQADVWQQLTFKGKYAGEVRTELTFYDTRENPQEKRRMKEKQQVTPTDSSTDLSLSSQRFLGPREIKRRPLPRSPADTPVPQGISQSEFIGPQRPSQEPLEAQSHLHAPVPRRLRDTSVDPEPELAYEQPHSQYSHQVDAVYEDRHYQQERHQRTHSLPPELPQQHWQRSVGRRQQDYYSESAGPDRTYGTVDYEQDSYQPEPPPAQSFYPDSREVWQGRRPQTVHMHSEPATPQQSSPLARPAPPTVNSDSQLQHYQPHQRMDADRTYTPVYQDSPLRQSMSQYDIQSHPAQYGAAPPPLPPKHKDRATRKQNVEHLPSMYIPQPLRIDHKRSSINQRSPLQSIEDHYDVGRAEEWEGQRTPPSHSFHGAPSQSPHEGSLQQSQLYSQRQTYNTQLSPLRSQPQVQKSTPQRRRQSYEIRHSSFGQQVTEEPQPITTFESYQSSYDRARQPTVQDAPPSPSLSPSLHPAPARKAVGDQPKKLSTLPFGPDSYDVLNPAQSPVTNENTIFQTSEQAKEARRMREIEKARGLAPIIGNDGKEIDPSDHLPSDTWAPEPEWKNKKPEHVIHIRSRINKPAGARASPAVIRHNYSGSARSTPGVPTPASSPVVHTPNSAGRRSNLQEPSSVRPLPNQPYSSPQHFNRASPAAASSPVIDNHPQQARFDDVSHYPQRSSDHRRLSFDNRGSDHQARPSLSEYEVPAANSYHPRGTSNNSTSPRPVIEPAYSGTPTKRHTYQAYSPSYEKSSYDEQYDYGYENSPGRPEPQAYYPRQQSYDDPLAAEMSMIDIGPSRNGYHQNSVDRSLVRSHGSYGM